MDIVYILHETAFLSVPYKKGSNLGTKVGIYRCSGILGVYLYHCAYLGLIRCCS